MKARICHHQKFQNKNFRIIRKYHHSMNFLAQKENRIFHLWKVENDNFSVIG